MMCLTSGGGAIPSLQHPVGELTPSEQLHKVSLSPEGLPRLGFLLQCPQYPWAYLRDVVPIQSMKPQGPGVTKSLCWGNALPTPHQMTYQGGGRASKQHHGLYFWNTGPHMAHMGQEPSHDVSYIRGVRHFPAYSPS